MRASRITGVVSLGAFILLSHSAVVIAAAQSSSPSTCPVVPASPAAAHSALNLADADSLLRVAVPRTMENHGQAMAYTYAIDYRNRNFTLSGKLLIDYSAKYDVIFVGDLPYRRQVEENRKPLTDRAAADEARRYDQAFAERTRMTLTEKRDYLRRPWNVDFPLPQLVGLFNNRVVGQELVAGRPAIVVESAPRPEAQPADEEETRALHKRVKLWIDRDDLIVSRIEATLVAEDAGMEPGTVAHIDFLRKDGVWLPAHSDVRFETKGGSQTVRGETTESNTGFERFRVDVRLLSPPDTGAGSLPGGPQTP